ncbi:hypothetical protein NIES37_73150 (plasmid) [Tolypothrix tenuis PCC 7101]|uniref:Uncharacterized protein n=1 Tax=Tolypothrix tenuis PCC 7101 TaxID=231146 RepID=A0A1Z4NCA3_9CYAN|nr:hypothetical protein [Aulosira sp. FACHB-113]BAZ03302.1 hypothetical protein NIES37_73150 [Tolypothrix tenuis PCC 7101]BAZ78727.1 hypothetical protein NIES50_73600 [Aulosira laxa NIES-50]
MVESKKFDDTLAAIELNAARKLNWDYNQFKDYFSFTVNKEAIEIVLKNPIDEFQLKNLKQALLDYGFQYKKTVDESLLVFEQNVELRESNIIDGDDIQQDT